MIDSVAASDRSDTSRIDEALREHCGGTKGKESKFVRFALKLLIS